MAKGNLLQGLGRGSVGDVTFKRVNGQQITQVRVRHPRNPRDDQQQYQRAVMATILRAYQAGQIIFSHSFSGNGTTASDQPLFIAANAKRLRDAISDDFQTRVPFLYQKGRVVAPQTVAPVPFTYQISKGKLQQTAFSIKPTPQDYDVVIPRPRAAETVASYCQRVGLRGGDYYTICVFAQSDSDFAWEDPDGDATVSQRKCNFSFARLGVRDDVSTNFGMLRYWSDVFELLTDGQAIDLQNRHLNSCYMEGIDISNIDPNGWAYGSVGVIRSRRNSDDRSTCIMTYLNGGNPSGISSTRLLEVWGRGGAVYPDPDQPLFTTWDELLERMCVFADIEFDMSPGMYYTGMVDRYNNRYLLRFRRPTGDFFPLGGVSTLPGSQTQVGNVSIWDAGVGYAVDDPVGCDEVENDFSVLPFVDCAESLPDSVPPDVMFLDITVDATCIWDPQQNVGAPQVTFTNGWGNVIGDVYGNLSWPVEQLEEVQVAAKLFAP